MGLPIRDKKKSIFTAEHYKKRREQLKKVVVVKKKHSESTENNINKISQRWKGFCDLYHTPEEAQHVSWSLVRKTPGYVSRLPIEMMLCCSSNGIWIITHQEKGLTSAKSLSIGDSFIVNLLSDAGQMSGL